MTNISLETEFFYLYGIILAEELQQTEVPSIMGIDQRQTKVKIYKEIAAIVTPVNALNFSKQQIELQLKDPGWLKEKAFHHHEVISQIHQQFTVIPMSFCTIFQNLDNLESLLSEQYDVILEKLTSLKDQQEWNLKMYCNMDSALSYVVKHNPKVVVLREQLATMPKGKQFLMKKKLEQLVTAEVEHEQAKWWQQISNEIACFATQKNLRKNWGKEVTERTDEMIVNCDVLVDRTRFEGFVNKIEELEYSFKNLGCSFQVTGPWPPYHFSKMDKGLS